MNTDKSLLDLDTDPWCLYPFLKLLGPAVVASRNVLCCLFCSCITTNSCDDAMVENGRQCCGAALMCPLLCPFFWSIGFCVTNANITESISDFPTKFYCLQGLLCFRLSLCSFCCGYACNSCCCHVNAQDRAKDNDTGLHMLVRKKENNYLSNIFLFLGADSSIKNTKRETPLHRAVQGENFEMVDKLFNKRPGDLFEVDIEGKMAYEYIKDDQILSKYQNHVSMSLPIACKLGSIDRVRDILFENSNDTFKMGGLFNSLKFDDKTSLELACENKHVDIVRLILKQFENLIIQKLEIGNSLHIAFENDNFEIIFLLMNFRDTKFRILDKNKVGKTPFDYVSNKKLIIDVLSSDFVDFKILEFNSFELWFYILTLDEDKYLNNNNNNKGEIKKSEEVETSLETNLPLSRLSQIVHRYVTLYPSLAFARDKSNRVAMDIATGDNKEAIKSTTLWHGRYRLIERRPEHISATCIVFRAYDDAIIAESSSPLSTVDGNSTSRPVALKLMISKSQFLREIDSRAMNFDTEYVVNILSVHPTPQEARESWPETIVDVDINEVCLDISKLTKSVAEKMFCVSMPLADRNLWVCLKQERWTGTANAAKVRLIFAQLVHCVAHIHSRGVLHGDIKTLNIVRIGSDYRLIDFDAACIIGKDSIGSKYSTAYVPPEAIYADANNAIAFVKSETNRTVKNIPEYSLLMSHPSFDIWSLGCILYQMCSEDIKPLFQAGQDDNLSVSINDEDSLYALHEWSDAYKGSKLSKVLDMRARNLLSQMLSKDPLKRPNISRILAHPFISGNQKVPRMIGEAAKFQVFLSYRVRSDLQIAEEIYRKLEENGVSVWWDKKSLKPGEDWKDGFCAGLICSKIFVCLLSREAINSPTVSNNNFSVISESSPCDNVLLEHRLALELRSLGLIEKIFPIFIGDEDKKGVDGMGVEVVEHGKYFEEGCLPRASVSVVTSVEEELYAVMEKMSLGTPMESNKSVSSVLQDIISCQGGKIEGHRGSAIEDIVKVIVDATCDKLSLPDDGTLDELEKACDGGATEEVIEASSTTDMIGSTLDEEQLDDEGNNAGTLEYFRNEYERSRKEVLALRIENIELKAKIK